MGAKVLGLGKEYFRFGKILTVFCHRIAIATDSVKIQTLLSYRNDESISRNSDNMRQMTESAEKYSENMVLLTEATKKDSGIMKLIAVITMIYLPGTFVAVRPPRWIRQWLG